MLRQNVTESLKLWTEDSANKLKRGSADAEPQIIDIYLELLDIIRFSGGSGTYRELQMTVILNFILLILITVGMFKRREKACLKSLVYYTILSNLISAFASLLVLIFGLKFFVEVIRYLSVCMMVMTFFVTAFILMPLSKGSRPFLYKGSGLLHHFICPALSLV